MCVDEIKRLWDEIDANYKNFESYKNVDLLERIISLASQGGRSAERARATIMRSGDLDRLPDSAPEAIEERLRSSIEVCRSEKDGRSEGLGWEALSRYYILSGDLIRANECYRTAHSIFDKLNLPVSKIFCNLSLEELWESVKERKRRELATVPVDQYLSGIDAIDLKALPNRIGDFVTADKSFGSQTQKKIAELNARLVPGLLKPENFLLLAEPGSGKSFFVGTVATKITDAHFVTHNVSTFPNRQSAFASIISSIEEALNAHKVVVALIDEADMRVTVNKSPSLARRVRWTRSMIDRGLGEFQQWRRRRAGSVSGFGGI
jgi:hypothetical protein